MLKLGSSLVKGGASLLTFVKDNLKLYLDFKSSRSDTLAFPSEGSTSFDGNDYIVVPDNDSLDIGTGNVTVSAWIKPAHLDSNHSILDKRGSDQLGINLTLHSSDRFFFQVSDGTNDYYDYSGSLLTLGQWHHVCAVWNPSTTYAKFYLDGVDVGRQFNLTNANVGNSDNTSELRIGRASSGYTNYYFDGKMANVAMWTRELSPEEVQSVMNKSYSQLNGVEKTSLVSWWALDSASNTNGAVDSQTETLGSELTTNGGFDTDSDWTKTSVTISNGKANFTNAGTTALFQDIGSSLTGLYKVSFEVTDYTSGTLRVFGGGQDSYSDTELLNATAIGSYTAYIILVGSFNGNIIFGGGSFYGSITNVSVKEVTSGNTGVVTGATTTTSVYGGNAPILPRAIDIAESQADAIGNGSALFNGSSNYIDLGDTSVFKTLGNSSFSFSAWINSALDSTDDDFISNSTGTDKGIGGRITSANKFRLLIVTDGSNFDGAESSVLNSGWNHVVVSWNGSTMKIYINGIDDTTRVNQGTLGDATSTNNLLIGRLNNASRYFNGNISQVGIWKGALTQAQIQSVMESTSYAKIPADVKSTLSAERVLNSDFSNEDTNWILSSASVVNSVLDVNVGNYTHFATQSSINQFLANKLYKVEIDITEYTSGTFILYATSTQIKNGVSGASTHTFYFQNGASDKYIRLFSQGSGFDGKISSISVKEVTNDLVAYYPLDADSSDISSLGITNDSVNGETLGINLIDNHNKDRWISAGGNSDDDITNGVQLIFGGGASGNYAYINDALLSTAGLASNTLYKTTFTASYSGGSSAPSIRLDDGTTTYDNVLTTTPTEYEVYFMKNGSPFLQIINQVTSNVTDVINWTIKEVTSNTGVLK
jgi:hypothetical protein